MMVLEWIPDVAKLSPLPTGYDTGALAMTEAQQSRLASALRLLDFDSSGDYDAGDIVSIAIVSGAIVSIAIVSVAIVIDRL